MQLVDLFGNVENVTATPAPAPRPRARHEQLGLFADESGELGGQSAATDMFGGLVDGGVLVASTRESVPVRK